MIRNRFKKQRNKDERQGNKFTAGGGYLSLLSVKTVILAAVVLVVVCVSSALSHAQSPEVFEERIYRQSGFVNTAIIQDATRRDNLSKSRIKDLATVQSAGGRRVFGMGLVVGLAGTGDGTGTEFTVQALVNLLIKRGITVDPDDVRVNNVAAVMVTTDLPTYARVGTRFDVVVSTMGDADSLEGGTLLYTLLQGGDEEVYASAQGPISIGGYNIQGGGGGGSVRKNHATAGRIPMGGVVERELPVEFSQNGTIRLLLNQNDFTTSARIAQAVDSYFGIAGLAHAIDPGVVEVDLSSQTGIFTNMVELVSQIEQIPVEDDYISKVVINERTGTIVAGAEIRIKQVAISHGNLLVSVRVPTPLDLYGIPSVQPPGTAVAEEETNLLLMQETITLGELVDALNRKLGVSSRDTIAILQALREAGALTAELVIM